MEIEGDVYATQESEAESKVEAEASMQTSVLHAYERACASPVLGLTLRHDLAPPASFWHVPEDQDQDLDQAETIHPRAPSALFQSPSERLDPTVDMGSGSNSLCTMQDVVSGPAPFTWIVCENAAAAWNIDVDDSADFDAEMRDVRTRIATTSDMQKCADGMLRNFTTWYRLYKTPGMFGLPELPKLESDLELKFEPEQGNVYAYSNDGLCGRMGEPSLVHSPAGECTGSVAWAEALLEL